jgi:hypothetical protein
VKLMLAGVTAATRELTDKFGCALAVPIPYTSLPCKRNALLVMVAYLPYVSIYLSIYLSIEYRISNGCKLKAISVVSRSMKQKGRRSARDRMGREGGAQAFSSDERWYEECVRIL